MDVEDTQHITLGVGRNASEAVTGTLDANCTAGVRAEFVLSWFFLLLSRDVP